MKNTRIAGGGSLYLNHDSRSTHDPGGLLHGGKRSIKHILIWLTFPK
jgi:hypothetical protein